LAWLLVALLMPGRFVAVGEAAAQSGPQSRVDAEGVAHVVAIQVSASRFMSAEARTKFIRLFSGSRPPPPADIRLLREADEQKNAPFVARAEELYPVTIEPKILGGVRTEVIAPKDGVAPRNRERVLINLHGGGFIWGEGNGARSESVPIAGVGKITVITVAYRLAPENKFPAASEDVAAVYRELLKTHRAVDIGIYGCSAGGILTAQAIVWFQKERLPIPGAIGTFCGSVAGAGGDSRQVAPALVGEVPPAGVDDAGLKGVLYLKDASPSDPLALPISSVQALRLFPPTLLIAGSRDFMLSSLFKAQAALTEAGVDAELHVWDGMWHAFFMDPDLPESQEVFRVVVKFFDQHLGRPPPAAAPGCAAKRPSSTRGRPAGGRCIPALRWRSVVAGRALRASR
jgi:acetyl esterase/lipase